MTESEIHALVTAQRAWFRQGHTLSVDRRLRDLEKLRQAICRMEDRILAALEEDLGKSRSEGYMCEVGMVLGELTYMRRHLRSLARPRRVPTPLAQFAARSFVRRDPYGVVLVMSPWNYPFLLSVEPLVDAIAAGNTVILKPSAYSPATGRVLAELVAQVFDKEQAAVVTGGRAENQCLLEEKFDYIFFTGSQAVGREVLRKAAPHLTPVTLELGGKSPCIITSTANIKLAARRVVFGKYLNCGQTCVAPDYVLCHASVKEAFLEAVKREITAQFGPAPLDNPQYGKIINEKHFKRILGLIDPDKVAAGGESDPERLKIAPTVLDNVTWEDRVMGEEIFGPLMPVLTYDSLAQVVEDLGQRPKPLALYLFTGDKESQETVLSRCAFGGGCINDTIIHLATSHMGFGGVGESGMGSYHGKDGFCTFTHDKSIVDKKTWLDLPMRYAPYTGFKDRLVRMFLK